MEEEKRKMHTWNLLDALKEADVIIGGGTVSVSGYASNATVVTDKGSMPCFTWLSGSSIPHGLISKIGEKRIKEGVDGALVLAPLPYSTGDIELFKKYKMTYLTYDDLINRLEEKGDRISELKQAIEQEKNEFVKQGAYPKACVYQELMHIVDEARDIDSKKKTLEELTCVLAQDLNLKDIEVNKRTPSAEIDVTAKNERTVGIWKELGTPIIFEAKNWEHPVSADEIRNLIGKATPARTRFLVAWNGVTGKDELKSARLEIIKAKERGQFVLVFSREDFEKIASGTHPKKLVEDKYYALIYDKVE